MHELSISSAAPLPPKPQIQKPTPNNTSTPSALHPPLFNPISFGNQAPAPLHNVFHSRSRFSGQRRQLISPDPDKVCSRTQHLSY